MARNNDVFKILVTKGDLPVLPKDKPIDDLKVGQLGVFDFDTNMSIDGTDPVRDFYIAVGQSSTGGTEMDKIKVSAGQVIQTRHIAFYTAQEAQDAQPMKFTISDFKVKCDSDYIFKIQFTNERILRRFGFTPFTKVYSATSGCCESECGCGGSCGCGDCIALTADLVENINSDKDGLVTAKLVAPIALTQADHGVAADIAIGDEIPETDIPALQAFNLTKIEEADKICINIECTSVPMKVAEFCSINLGFFNPLQTTMVPSLVEGFSCNNGKITITQEAKYEVGSGRALAQKEYISGGFYGNPSEYRVNSATGFPKQINYDIDVNATYSQIHLTYDQESISAWLEYKNNLATTIAIPSNDSTTFADITGVLNAIVDSVGIKPIV